MVEMVPGLPPAARIGSPALSGRSAFELAFIAGRHLSWYRARAFSFACSCRRSPTFGELVSGGAQHRQRGHSDGRRREKARGSPRPSHRAGARAPWPSIGCAGTFCGSFEEGGAPTFSAGRTPPNVRRPARGCSWRTIWARRKRSSRLRTPQPLMRENGRSHRLCDE